MAENRTRKVRSERAWDPLYVSDGKSYFTGKNVYLVAAWPTFPRELDPVALGTRF